MVLEKTLESPLDCKEMQPVHSEGDQPWDFFRRNDAEAETPELLQELVCSKLAQLVKNLPAMQETQVRFLGWEDLLEKG